MRARLFYLKCCVFFSTSEVFDTYAGITSYASQGHVINLTAQTHLSDWHFC